MTRAIVARVAGDDYQARWFWMQACRLFYEHSKVIRVEYETPAVRVFDDVAVFYGDGMRDEDGYPLRAEYYQVKFHVTYAGAFTAANLADPDFINATSASLLQRLRDAQRQQAPDGIGVQFVVHSPWAIDYRDLLARVVSATDGRIEWQRLCDGGPNSVLGRLRRVWREHLEIGTDDELEMILRPLRLRQGVDLAYAQRQLNYCLLAAGLIPVDDGAVINPYDDLIRKLHRQGKTTFTRDSLVPILQHEGLWRASVPVEPAARQIGIRSFLRYAERLEDETDDMLSLLQHFEGQTVKASDLWASHIFPEVENFLKRQLSCGRRLDLHLHAHASIAVAAGYCLDPKAGIDVAVVQSTPSGRSIWRSNLQHNDPYPGWFFLQENIRCDEPDVAVALSVTHDIREEVRAYVARQLPQVGRIIWATITPTPSNMAVLDGTHADQLTQWLASELRNGRTLAEREQTLHIFAAAPNSLLFFFGRRLCSVGRCTLYEYLKDCPLDTRYQASLSLPPGTPAMSPHGPQGIKEDQ